MLMLGRLNNIKKLAVLGLALIIGLVSMAKEGLGKWFAQKWVDVKTGQPCGRSKASTSSRPYPACRPQAAANKMTKQEKTAIASRKTSSKRQSWPVSPSGTRRTT